MNFMKIKCKKIHITTNFTVNEDSFLCVRKNFFHSVIPCSLDCFYGEKGVRENTPTFYLYRRLICYGE